MKACGKMTNEVVKEASNGTMDPPIKENFQTIRSMAMGSSKKRTEMFIKGTLSRIKFRDKEFISRKVWSMRETGSTTRDTEKAK